MRDLSLLIERRTTAVSVLVAAALLVLVVALGLAAGFGLTVPALWAAGSAAVMLAPAAVLAWRLRSRYTALVADLREAIDRAAQGDDPDSPGAGLPAPLTDAVAQIRRRARDRNSSARHLQRVFASVSEAVFIVDPTGTIELANESAARLCGADLHALTGRPIDKVLRPIESVAATHSLTGGPWPTEANLIADDGQQVAIAFTKFDLHDESGRLESSIYTAGSVEERKQTEQRMRYLARTDALTKVPNRMEFQHRLQQAVARTRRGHQYLALLYLDVDRFKDINDTFGHAAGDRSLEMFARRIGDSLPEGSIFGRLASDEFSVLLPAQGDIEQLVAETSRVAELLLKVVARPFEIQGEEIFMSTSIGIALYPRDGDSVVDLLRNADAAMNHAKGTGGNSFELYERHMNTSAEERLKLKSRLSRAFERNELRLHYQPKYRLTDGRIAGAEALIRWDLPDYGLVYPSDFIPLAEESNLILQVGEWVLDRVCADYREWQRQIPSPCRISVNLSLRQLQQQRFIEGVQRTFRRHNVSPTCLELEITETTLMQNTRSTVRLLEALYGMGLHLAIDDFGTGYSSLSAIQQFPIGTLKIDRSFVQDLGVDKNNAAIVRSIIQMSHSLNLEVVAEGVEYSEQLEFLRRHGCDYAQGNLLADPMTATDFLALLLEDSAGSGRYRALFG
jgi:diguanylate cyclase (GGDEF)-like protein